MPLAGAAALAAFEHFAPLIAEWAAIAIREGHMTPEEAQTKWAMASKNWLAAKAAWDQGSNS